MGEQAPESPESPPASTASSPPDSKAVWLRQRRLKIALGIAVAEGIFVAVSPNFSRWTVIIIAAPVIAFYLFYGRTVQSETGRHVAWIAAASQAFAALLAIIAVTIKLWVLIAVGIFAVVALILLLGERPTRSSKAP